MALVTRKSSETLPEKNEMDLHSKDFWAAFDHLAAQAGRTRSGLARAAGLDPTAFNPSKRTLAGGQERWPSTATLAKVLSATNMSFSEFARLVERSQDGAPP
jgi:phage repressor protein C with HTH and peptisase S24 domain